MYGKKTKIKSFLKAFVLIFTFAFINPLSVSYAIEPNVEYPYFSDGTRDETTTWNIGDFTPSIINQILINFSSDSSNTNYKESLDTLIETLEEENYKYLIYYNESKNKYYLFITNKNYNVDICLLNDKANIALICTDIRDEEVDLGCLYGMSAKGILFRLSSDCVMYYRGTTFSPYVNSIYKCNVDIYQVTKVSGLTAAYYWDGFSYYYEAPEQGGSNGINLTDEEIAEIVTRFVNSEAYITNNKYNYNDYFITYDNLTGYYRAYSYHENMDLAISYGNYNEDGDFVTTGTEEGEAWQIRPYVFDGNIFRKLYDWLASIHNNVSFQYYSISPDSTINPRLIGYLEHSYCSNYRENEIVVYSTKQIRYLGEETNSEGETETIVIDDYIPKTVLKDSVTGEEIIIKNNLHDSLENIITPNADFSGLKEAFEKYISFVNISSITWLTTAISSMITIFIPFVVLGIILFLIDRILNGGS